MKLDFSLLQSEGGSKAQAKAARARACDREAVDEDRAAIADGHSQAAHPEQLSAAVTAETAVTARASRGSGAAQAHGTESLLARQIEGGLISSGLTGHGGHTQCSRGCAVPGSGHSSDHSGHSAAAEAAVPIAAPRLPNYAPQLDRWIEDRCRWRERAWGGLGALGKDFAAWLARRGIPELRRPEFIELLEQDGFTVDRKLGLCTGLRLADDLPAIDRKPQRLPASPGNKLPAPAQTARFVAPRTSLAAVQAELAPGWATRKAGRERDILSRSELCGVTSQSCRGK